MEFNLGFKGLMYVFRATVLHMKNLTPSCFVLQHFCLLIIAPTCFGLNCWPFSGSFP